MFKVDAAKEAGYTDTEIANYLAQKNNFNIKAAREAGYEDTQIADFLAIGRELGAAEAAGIAFERTATAETRGGSELLQGVLDVSEQPVEATPGYEDPLAWMNGSPLSAEPERASIAAPEEKQLTDIEREQLYRIALRQQTGASIAGALTGAVLSPSSFVGGIVTKNFLKGAATVGGFGAATGAIEPVYEEFGDSRAENIGYGAVIGAGVGGALGAITSKLNKAKMAVDNQDYVDKVAAKFDEDVPKPSGLREDFVDIDETNNLPSLLSKAPEADQSYVDNILSRYGDDEPIPVAVLDEVAETVEDKNVAALFRKASKTAVEAVPENQLAKASNKQKKAKAAAQVDAPKPGSKALSRSTLEYAEATGDYRDYLTRSVTRFAAIPPNQFAKMVDSENPYKDSNFKILVSRLSADDPNLQQVYGAIQGRMKYEKRPGTSFEDMKAEAYSKIPREVSIEAILNRKIEEIVPPEVFVGALEAAGEAIDTLMKGKELARYARESNNEEAYALIQMQMGKSAALIASLEGNASNLGRAMSYLKQSKDIVDAGREMLGYLGGVKC